MRLFLIEPRQETFVRVKLDEKKASDKDWVPVHIKKKRKYFVATHDESIKHTIVGPAWVTSTQIEHQCGKDENYFVLSGNKK